MTKEKTVACASCDMCGREVQSNFTCTLILNKEDNTEEACWCVCPDCASRFKKDVKDFYDAVIDEEK
ncbi:hypothetical protein MFMK1_001454 [Metallumcola ferriviriculae]|uniref:Uncharacterized protein n=1 Tax=Metallumcola ferriviriculae TaxID=3039180 RepID=A0AAU0UN87_9FIRM|nr:hypothetical protein MFMK1_001454 [Desulfitibacteraceae bacterium MK1]